MKQIIKVALATVALIAIFAGFGLASPASGQSSTHCVDNNRYATPTEAKAKYHNRCTIRFQETTAFRCDWYDRGPNSSGFACSGPGYVSTDYSSSGGDYN